MRVLASQRHDERGLTNIAMSLIIFVHEFVRPKLQHSFQFPFWGTQTYVAPKSTASITLWNRVVNSYF